MLKLTKKADYGLIALRHLAVAGGNGTKDPAHHDGPANRQTPERQTASAKDIAETYSIPLPLLSKVLQKLTRGGLLVSEQGTHGGYRLARDPKNITVLEVIRTIDGPIILTQCFTEHPGCDQSARCTVREPLRKVHEGILGLLSNISLSDLASDDMQVPSGVSSIRPKLANIQLTGISPLGVTTGPQR